MKKIFAILTALLLGFATATAQTWSCGEYPNTASVTATLSNGVLTISGTGSMSLPLCCPTCDEESGGEDERCPPWELHRNQITKVVIGEGVTLIDREAFAYCDSLTSVTLPNSLWWIGEYAFMSCSSLTEITLPAGVAYISTGAFNSCNLTSVIVLKPTPPYLDCYLRYGNVYCPFDLYSSSLCIYVLPEALAAYQSNSDWRRFCLSDCPIGTSGNSGNITWSLCNGALTISGTGAMPDYNYNSVPWGGWRHSITSVVIDSGVTSIGSYAFNDCYNLVSVTIPSGITTIGSYAFASTSLSSLTIPEGVTSIGNGVFEGCGYLASVTLPNSLISIGSYAFNDMGLASITFGNSLESIGNSAFAGCWKLTSVALPNSVTSIGSFAFECSALISVALPNSLTSISYGMFNDCPNLTEITIPSSITSIGSYAFNNCTKLYYQSWLGIPSGVTSIGTGAFQDCTGINELYTGNNVTSIGTSAFQGCTSLASVTLGGSVASIGSSAFQDCEVLASVTNLNPAPPSLGSSVFSNVHSGFCAWVPSGAFADYVKSSWNSYFCINGCRVGNAGANIGWNLCDSTLIISGTGTMTNYSYNSMPWYSYRTAITQVVIDSGVTSVGNNAFYSHSNLTSVNISGSVTSIGSNAFSNCTELTSITSLNPTPPSLGSSDVFNGVNKQTCCLYVPPGSEAAYQSAAQWQDFGCVVAMVGYTVTFNAQGGSSVSSQAVLYNSTATAPSPAPVREGYTFVGWYADTTIIWGNPAWNFSMDTVTSDTTLYARWAQDIDNHRCTEGKEFIIRIPFRSLPQGVTAQYRWYRNGTLIVGSNGTTTSSDSHIVCTIPPNEAYGVNDVFYFEYMLNDDCPTCWTPSPRYTISFVP